MADINPVQTKMGKEQFNFKITGLGANRSESISATMLNDLVISGANSFSSAGDMVREGMGGFMGIGDRVMTKGADLLNNKVMGRQLAGFGKYNKTETRAKWTESSKPQFTIEFVLVASTAADALYNAGLIQALKSATLPINDKGALLAPLGYRSVYKNGKLDLTGTLTFSLGKWFVATKLIMVNESCRPSRQVTSNGYPLSWDCAVTLETMEMITIDDFRRYFQQPAVLNPNQNLNAPTNSQGAESVLRSKISRIITKIGR